MTTKGFFFIPLRVIFSYTYVFVDAHSRPLPAERAWRRTTRSRAALRLYTRDSPPAQSLACDRVQCQPPSALARPPLPHTPRLVGSVSQSWQLAPQLSRVRVWN